MHTATMTQRFGVPALVAATFHVVLLFGIRPDVPAIIDRIKLDPPIKLPPMPVELITPKVDLDPVVEAVKPLSKPGPVKPVTEDRSVDVRPDVVVDPFTPPSAKVDVKTDKIPNDWGDGTTGAPVVGDPRSPGIFTAVDLDAHPRAKAQIPPEYPFAMRSAGVEGSVTVEFDVDASGRVTSARAVKSSAREFEEPAVRAVLKWRFESGKRHGKPVPFRMVVPIGFTMTDRD